MFNRQLILLQCTELNFGVADYHLMKGMDVCSCLDKMFKTYLYYYLSHEENRQCKLIMDILVLLVIQQYCFQTIHRVSCILVWFNNRIY